jgi:streptogramin lyase
MPTMNRKLLILVAVAMLGCVSVPASACRPFGSYQFAEDDSGGIWFTEGDNNAVSRLAPDGTVTAHRLPTPHSEPSSVALDREGNVWYVGMDAGKIGRIHRDGRITEQSTTGGKPFQVAVDAGGDAWFTQMFGHEGEGKHADHGSHGVAKIGRIDRRGRMHSYPLAEGWPSSIAFARGQVMVTIIVPGSENARPKGRLARLSRDGRWTIEKAWDDSCPRNLVADGSDAVYFSDGCRGIAGMRAADGHLAEWPLPSGVRIQQMSLARDGKLWFTDREHLGHIDGAGKVTFADRPANGDATMAVLASRSGDVVFSEFYNYNINRLTKNGELVEHLVNVDARKGAREVKEGEVCYVQFAARIAAKAEMDARRAEEVKHGRFKPDGAGTEKLVEQKCLVCHDARRLLLSRRSDWTPSLTRMHSYREVRGVEALTPEETTRLVRYFNEHYGLR